ncbi:MAG: hypothetical protein HY912_08165 [Desulfomonile tiedjei]|uniref:Uncharacterized protein n=1 Tax=Desulfomonile tiedjei TaxID=2358 RepID=A0A9D6V0V3_9BACT|nr:hypothetical protein [Desulfomonile tiedjei]
MGTLGKIHQDGLWHGVVPRPNDEKNGQEIGSEQHFHARQVIDLVQSGFGNTPYVRHVNLGAWLRFEKKYT